ncbi:hypothetical protein PHYPSEUDO_010111 [Phytophthora pseudosyringae]|uniref:Uncharacterized protein n=1 Tax=Phytophthora pseudosyringae TaxID=221518 RepID=A0A8T1VAZ0_9STRA|nr:hypothetical protein PHYPSEUDO_010111 [Phytophthora pseudosyringae]
MARNTSTRRQGLPLLGSARSVDGEADGSPSLPQYFPGAPYYTSGAVKTSMSAEAEQTPSEADTEPSRGTQRNRRPAQRSRRQGRGAVKDDGGAFAWTENAAATMLKLRYGALKESFQEGRNSRQIMTAWVSLSSESSCGSRLNRPRRRTALEQLRQ